MNENDNCLVSRRNRHSTRKRKVDVNNYNEATYEHRAEKKLPPKPKEGWIENSFSAVPAKATVKRQSTDVAVRIFFLLFM